jgi:transcriptional regulator with XRE-family HTH domain
MSKHWLDNELKAAGKSNGDLAACLGLPQSRITDIKAGRRNVSISEATKIADFLNRPLDVVAQELTSPSSETAAE